MNLTDALNCYCSKHLDDRNWYHWEIQEKYFHTHFEITLEGETCFDKTVELKNKLHEKWQSESDSDKRKSIIKAYISVWGGIKRISDGTINYYMTLTPKCLISLGKKGVASWSKALVIQDPQQYAIFDARVSLSLNCLQEMFEVEDKYLFPILNSRNKKVQEGNKKIADISGNWEKPDDSKFYDRYLSDLKSVADHNHTDIATIEMLLFAKAEDIWMCFKNNCKYSDIQKDNHNRIKLCSACLLGLACRYNGESVPHEKVLCLASEEVLIPVCPEQMGGLPTPRPAVELKNGCAVTIDGKDVTENFEAGACQVLEIARLYGIDTAILKQRSPSCGCGQVYDGTFSGSVVPGNGITAQLLLKNGVKVLSEEEL